MRKLIEIITVIFPLTGVFLLLYLAIPIFYLESYFPLKPYIDTKFSQDFNPENFEKVKRGMNKAEVEIILGKPLKYSTKIESSIQPHNTNISIYAGDGKSNWGDFAWKSFDVYYNKNNIVVGKKSQWWYD